MNQIFPHRINLDTGMNDLGHVPIWFDAEFTSLSKDAQLISIGLISISGSYFYAEFNDYDLSQVSDDQEDWLNSNVIQNLMAEEDGINTTTMMSRLGKTKSNRTSCFIRGDHELIATELNKWLHDELNHVSSNDNSKIQFYCDCYAYDWVLLNDLLSRGKSAQEIPGYIYYIPMDLCTEMQMVGIDPDISREEFIGEDGIRIVKLLPLFKEQKQNIKHNALFDAYVAQLCTIKIQAMLDKNPM